MTCRVVPKNGKFDVLSCDGKLIKTCDTEGEANTVKEQNDHPPEPESKPWEPKPF